MSWKIVWNDSDFCKVLRCESYTEDEHFIIAVDFDGREIRLGKKYIISIKPED